MKIRHLIENDIVENIYLYKTIHNEFINFMREEVKSDYEPNFTFDEFCVRMINNFEGVDDDMRDEHDDPLTKKLLRSIMKIAEEEILCDEECYKKLNKIIKEEKL
jgi:lipoate-protein ligase A